MRNEPYRYAIPRSTETKLAKLRVKASGERRKSGSPKGQKCVAKLPGGSRTIKALPEVCRSEGLPAPRPLSPGEQRLVAEAGCAEFVAQIAAAQVVPRPPKRRKAEEERRLMIDKLPMPTASSSTWTIADRHPAKAFARIVRASKGAHCRPLHPRLASSLLFRAAALCKPCSPASTWRTSQLAQPENPCPPVDTDRGTGSCTCRRRSCGCRPRWRSRSWCGCRSGRRYMFRR